MTSLGPTSPASDLAAALRARELSSIELLDACLAAVDARNPELNAVIWRDDDAARAGAKAADERLAAGDNTPFLGVPIPIKDLTPAAGQPCTYGSFGGSDEPCDQSELTVEALVRAGFVLCGRTNTPEFGPITVTENSRYGITRNPWDTSRSSGGSSGGASAAVAGGMFPVAHATDGGGSIRIPAAYTGLVGLKPSRGRVPRRAQGWMGGIVELAVTRSVADAAAILDALSGPDPLAWNNAPAPQRPFLAEVGADQPALRVGLMAQAPLGIPTDPACVEGARSAAGALEALGHSVEEVDVPTVSEELIGPFIVLTNAGLGDYDGVDWSKVEPHIAYQHKKATTELSAVDFVVAARALEELSRTELARWGRDFDVLLTPTSAILPPIAGSILEAQHAAPDQPIPEVVASVSFTAFANVAGSPAISLPLHRTAENLPVGVQITGGPFDEATLIRLAAQLEESQPWAQHVAAVA